MVNKQVVWVIIASLGNNDGDGHEYVTQKVKSRCFKLYRAYSISFISSNVGNIFLSWILKDCIKIQEKKQKVVVLFSRPQFHAVVVHWRQRNVPKKRDARAKLLFFQSKPIAFLPFSLSWRRRCLNSLMTNLFSLSPVTVPEVFATAYSVQFPGRKARVQSHVMN